MSLTTPTRPVLRYHGGKWVLAPWVIQHFPEHRVYTEAFGGAASVLLRKERAYAEVYNDLDGEVVNVFRVLRDPTTAAELERLLRLTPFARAEFEQAYEPTSDPVEQARRTIARAYMGFGSAAASGRRTGFRSNVTRPYTTPMVDWATYPDQLAAFTERLRGVAIECLPALSVLEKFDGPEALHYVDPPYVFDTRYQGNGGEYRHELSDQGHRELAATLHELEGMVVLSGYPCDLYDELYGDWRCVTRTAFADGARERTEALWLNAAAAEALDATRSQPGIFAEVPA